MKFNEVVSQFLLDVEIRKRSNLTLKEYRRCLGQLTQMLDTVCQVTQLENITIIHLRKCLQYLMNDPLPMGRGHRIPLNGNTLSIATIRAHVRVWKTFFNWCYQEELLEKNPINRLVAPSPEKRIVLTFTEDHIERMLSACDTSTVVGFRDYVILLLLLDTGMRLCEISTLKVSDLNETYVKVFGKGRKEREIGVHPTVSKLLWKYIHKFRFPVEENEQALFLGSGRSSGKPLGYGGVKQVLERIKRISGVTDVRLSAHTFRHTFAKMYLSEGGEIFKLSREMGHSSTQVTKIYLEDFNSSEARKEHNSFSPINRLKINKQAKRTDPDKQYRRNKEE